MLTGRRRKERRKEAEWKRGGKGNDVANILIRDGVTCDREGGCIVQGTHIALTPFCLSEPWGATEANSPSKGMQGLKAKSQAFHFGSDYGHIGEILTTAFLSSHRLGRFELPCKAPLPSHSQVCGVRGTGKGMEKLQEETGLGRKRNLQKKKAGSFFDLPL